MRISRIIACAALLVCIAAVFSCSGNKEPDSAVNQAADDLKTEVNDRILIASIGDAFVFQDDIENYISSRPVNPGGAETKDIIDTYLTEMITMEVLYQEALRQKIHEHPAMKRKIKQMLNGYLLEEMVVNPVTQRKISEEELKQFYTSHIDEYVSSEQIRLADIFIAVPRDASAKGKNEKRTLAENILAEALKPTAGRSGFGDLIRTYSDKHPLYPVGDTGFFDRQGMPFGLDKPLVEQGFLLETIRSVSDEPVETESGFHIIMLVGKKSAVKREFKDVMYSIERRIKREELVTARRHYIENLKNNTQVQINTDAMNAMVKQMNPPSDTEIQIKEALFEPGGLNPTAPPGLPN